jgi:glucosylglycerate synthase
MPEVNSIPQQAQQAAAQIETADLVIGLLADLDRDGIATLCEGLRALQGSPRIVILQSTPTGDTSAAPPETAQTGASPCASLSLLPWAALTPDPAASPTRSITAACQSLFEVSEKLEAKACCLVASKIEGATPKWISQLAQPLLESNCDLVLPYYPLRKLQGLLNSSILYPLTRCLFGKRIHNPLGPDIGVSRRLSQKILAANRNAKNGQNQVHPLASLAPAAICDNLQICQVRVGSRFYPPIDWTNTSSLLSQVMGPIFLSMEKTAPCWQRTRGSVSVPTRGEPISIPQETETLDMNRMVETFKLGVRDLQEIWGLVLPPATLFELRTLSRLTPEQVEMPDELWARIVYDFALAHRLRTINRDHLLRSMTPLYLAWVSSYAREMEAASAASVGQGPSGAQHGTDQQIEQKIEQRLERLCLAYEAAKPYLVSRWRWPDRFNP